MKAKKALQIIGLILALGCISIIGKTIFDAITTDSVPTSSVEDAGE